MLAAAGCRGGGAPVAAGAPGHELRSELRKGTATPGAVHRCLFVMNHTKQTAAVFVDGRHAGWIGPESTAGFFVGRSAPARARLTAVAGSATWEATAEGPVWDFTWHLLP